MALWICGRPADKCHPAEVAVAEQLSRLSDDWTVCWGFRYGNAGSIEPQREGDFVVQAPSGRVCVIEVKSGRLRQFALTGYWECDGRDNPADQLHAEWQGVIRALEHSCTNGPTPVVHRALALPNVNFVDGDRFHGQLARSQLLDAKDLARFPQWWTANVESLPIHCTPGAARACFREAFAQAVQPKSLRFFIGETDALLLRQQESESGVLDLLRENRQLIVEGSCGSGKTFLALEQARRWAERGEGQRVLLVCYNIPLAEQLAVLIRRQPPERGEIVTASWEAIAARLLAEAGIAFSPPADPQERWKYFTLEVPGLLIEVLKDGGITPSFDALVVDEGQDHDTVFPAELNCPELPGWWSFYLAMLQQGGAANIAVFFDRAQRPRFRRREDFSRDVLLRLCSQPALLHMPRALRYTRPVFNFLDKLQRACPGEVGRLLAPPEFREGPEVEEYTIPPAQVLQQVTDIAERWISCGFCRAHDILILGHRRQREKSSLGDATHLGSIPFADFSTPSPPNHIVYLNVHRAKGLDRLAVILIDYPHFSTLQQTNDADGIEALFAGASRARQLLAVVSVASP